MAGRPLAGMGAALYSVKGGEEQAKLHFLIVKEDPVAMTAELSHIVRKTPDPSQWAKSGLRILSERHYHDDFNFSNQLTALFGLDSAVAEALKAAGACHLKFKQDSIEHAFDFDVEVLDENDCRLPGYLLA